jgi:carbon-monoxide dehydrogenase medium subunit
MPSRFGYVAPSSEPELLAAVATSPAPVRVLSGGTWLVPLLTAGETEARTVVDLRDAGLDGVEADGDVLRIGAAVTYATVLSSPIVGGAAPLFQRMAATITGGPQIRHQGTIGGAAAYATPASDVPAVLVALGAQIVVASAMRGRRSIDADGFFRDAYRTELAPDEVLIEIAIPAGRARVGYQKLKFGESSWPVVTAAAVIDDLGDVSVAVGGAFARPVLVRLGKLGDVALRGAVGAATEAALAEVDAPHWADEFADWDYRRRVAPVLVARAVQMARTGAS